MTPFNNLRNLCNLWLIHRSPRGSVFFQVCRARVSALLCFVLSSAAFAQSKGTKHTCRILFFDGPENAPEKLQLFDGKGCREVDLPRMNFSKVYELPPGAIHLYLLPAPPPDATKLPPGAPSVALAEEVTDFYLLVTSDPANPITPVRMQIINASGDRHKAGQMLWFNLTNTTVGGTVGSEKLVIQPNSRVILDQPSGINQDYPVNLTFRLPGDERLYPLCETNWRHDPRSRSVVFIATENGIRAPRVMAFPDYREPKSQKSDMP